MTGKKISLIVLILLYVAAGINHFVHPSFYTQIIPPYFPNPTFLVFASGMVEIIFGILLIKAKTRRVASISIAVMLVFFLPVHIYMVQQAYTVPNYRVSIEAAWLRLLLQPLLVLWVLWHRK